MKDTVLLILFIIVPFFTLHTIIELYREIRSRNYKKISYTISILVTSITFIYYTGNYLFLNQQVHMPIGIMYLIFISSIVNLIGSIKGV
jgi:hypothetical protein